MGNEWTEIQEDVFRDRYALRRDGEIIETSFDQLARRVAFALARSASQAMRFKDAIASFSFLPAGRVLAGAGAEEKATYYNCFVLGIGSRASHGRDSRQGIMQTLADMVEITARGGGVGVNWSVLRPEGAHIRGVRGTSTGPLGWMLAADSLANQIRQGGTRTAALMFMLDVWHPDALRFVESGKIFHRANYSIAIGDRFMSLLARGGAWEFVFPETTSRRYDSDWAGDIRSWVASGGEVRCHGKKDTAEVWRRISAAAWATGNPGVVFLDRCNRMSNTWYLERLIGTNPCGEQPLPESGCCNLGAINLVAHRAAGGGIDHDALRRTVSVAVEMLDRVIDCSAEITPEITRAQKATRRIGIGVMGLADLMLMEKVRYGSDESCALIREVMRTIRDHAYLTSSVLALQFGSAPGYRRRFLQSEFVRTLPSEVREPIDRVGIRNLALLSQAPTGTISILAGVSSGIEPNFAREYVRRDATGEHVVKHPLLGGDEEWAVTAQDVTVEEHIRVQAEVQKYIDSSISKTINLPASATVEDVERAFRLAYDMGCKGVTIYRDGSQTGQVLSCPAGEGKCE